MKWKEGVLYSKKVPLKAEGKFYKTVMRSSMMYRSEYWALNKRENTNESCENKNGKVVCLGSIKSGINI